MPIQLSPRTKQIAAALFDEPERIRITERLVREASENIPFYQNATPERMERIRFSIMKLIAENPKNEDDTFDLARVDWRDLFMAAGFGYSTTEHERWHDETLKNNA